MRKQPWCGRFLMSTRTAVSCFQQTRYRCLVLGASWPGQILKVLKLYFSLRHLEWIDKFPDSRVRLIKPLKKTATPCHPFIHYSSAVGAFSKPISSGVRVLSRTLQMAVPLMLPNVNKRSAAAIRLPIWELWQITVPKSVCISNPISLEMYCTSSSVSIVQWLFAVSSRR